MSRAIKQGIFRDGNGAVVTTKRNGTVSVFLAGTLTPADIYTVSIGGIAVHSVTTDASGRFKFYIDYSVYSIGQQFDVVLSGTGINSQTYQDELVYLLPYAPYEYDAILYSPNTYTQATIQAALNAIGTSNKVTLLIRPGIWPIISNADWSAYTNVTFKIVPGAVISHGAFTINIPNLDAELYQVFTGTGIVTLSGSVKEVYPEWWGAKADFVPSTGVGTDSRVAIQSAFDSVVARGGNATIRFSGGKYYLGTGFAWESYKILLGSPTVVNVASNIVLDGAGSELYGSGLSTSNYICYLATANVNHIEIKGFSFYGYAGGALSSAREFDTLLSITDSSTDVDIHNCYFTNSIGYTVGLSTEDGYPTQNIRFHNNIVKSRVGNGVGSGSSGTRASGATIFSIDAIGLSINDNIIYGQIDLEPNHAGAHIWETDIRNNQFLSGWVTPLATVPVPASQYWSDEVFTTDKSGTEIPQQITAVSDPPTGYLVANVSIKNNYMENGLIAVFSYVNIIDNLFNKGLILTGGGGVQTFGNNIISGNIARVTRAGYNGFIEINEKATNTAFLNNFLLTGNFPCVYIPTSGDDGSNIFKGNESLAYTTPPSLGRWITPAYDAENFTSDSGTWVVEAADILTYAYTISGKTMTVSFSLQTTTITGIPSSLMIAVPGGVTVSKPMWFATSRVLLNNVSESGGDGSASGGVITLYRPAAANYAASADNNYFAGTVTFEID